MGWMVVGFGFLIMLCGVFGVLKLLIRVLVVYWSLGGGLFSVLYYGSSDNAV